MSLNIAIQTEIRDKIKSVIIKGLKGVINYKSEMTSLLQGYNTLIVAKIVKSRILGSASEELLNKQNEFLSRFKNKDGHILSELVEKISNGARLAEALNDEYRAKTGNCPWTSSMIVNRHIVAIVDDYIINELKYQPNTEFAEIDGVFVPTTEQRVQSIIKGVGKNLGKALLIAAKIGDIDVVAELVGRGVDVDVRDEVGNTSLHLVAGSMHDGLAKFLIGKGARSDIENNVGFTPEQVAKMGGYVEFAGLLCKPGNDVGGIQNSVYTLSAMSIYMWSVAKEGVSYMSTMAPSVIMKSFVNPALNGATNRGRDAISSVAMNAIAPRNIATTAVVTGIAIVLVGVGYAAYSYLASNNNREQSRAQGDVLHLSRA